MLLQSTMAVARNCAPDNHVEHRVRRVARDDKADRGPRRFELTFCIGSIKPDWLRQSREAIGVPQEPHTRQADRDMGDRAIKRMTLGTDMRIAIIAIT